MTNYFNPINVVFFIMLILLFMIYNLIADSLLKSINLDPTKSSAINIGSIYIAYTIFNLVKVSSIGLGFYLSKYFNIENFLE